jgi:hypothetical protein
VLADTKKRRGPRATPGAFDTAVLRALADGAELTNAQIRVKLAAAHYPHSLTPSHVSGELGRMARSGKLTMTRKGSNSTYRVPAAAPAARELTSAGAS